MKKTTNTLGLLLLAGLCVSAGAAAQVATMSYGSSAVTWSVYVAHDGATLSVSGGGRAFSREFEAGESPRFDTFDVEGNALPDGLYKWQLWLAPPKGSLAKAEFENARTNADGSFVMHGKSPTIEPQWGTFRILNGAIVDPNLAEGAGAVRIGGDGVGKSGAVASGGAVTNDQVILDDLIVDGSACIGFDCVNGESFGFDTIRIKENNLRIKAQDTSSSASFPSNDWQITFNESSNGGANKFSIDDITGGRTPMTIEASAPSHSLYVDDGGRLGLGTSTPVVDLHVVSGNTPTLRLEQNGSSGFTPQTFDVAGNEANFFIRDATNGSTLPFRIQPGADTNAMYIAADNDVGLNAGTSPGAPLHVKRTGTTGGADQTMLLIQSERNPAIQLADTNAADADGWRFKLNDNNNNFDISRDGSGAAEFRLVAADASAGVQGSLTISGDYFSTTCTTPCAPDYVFEPAYELMPLGELRQFVQENKHLPNVPSAEELVGPINMSELQMTLLEKIEELTLYTLDQEERLLALAERNAALEARLLELTESEQ